MNSRLSFWAKNHALRKITWVVLFTFLFNIIAFDLAPLSSSNRIIGVPAAQAAVSDKDGLGTEGFWSYFGKDLGAGWKYSANTFNGNLIVENDLVNIPGRGTGLSEGLVYNALSTQSGIVGIGWKLKNDLFLKENADGSVTFKDADGTNHKFTKNADGSYTPPDGIYLTLAKVNTTTFTIKVEDNSILRFQNGYLSSITDENGNATSFAYDANNRLTAITDPSGRKLTYSYNASGLLSKITDPANRAITFGYWTGGRLRYVDDPKGNRTTLYYDTSFRLNEIRDANYNSTKISYNSGSKVVKIDDARSTISKAYSTTFTYDANLLKTTVTDPAGKSIVYNHNSAGNLIKLQDGAGTTIDFIWDKNNLIKITDANGYTTASYDSSGNITTIADTLDASTNATTTIDYDTLNNPTTITNPNNNQVTAKYDENSNMLSSGNPDRKEADANTYDTYGNITSSTEPGAPTYNLLQNGSFEWTDANGAPQFWYLGGNTAAISVDNSNPIYGNTSVKITSPSSTTAYLYSRKIDVAAGQKLTLSSRIKMDQVQGTGGVAVGIEYYDANSNYIGSEYSNFLRGTANDGILVTSDAPTGAVEAYGVLVLWNASGTVWFDGAQLETPVSESEGHIFTRFDYVEDSSFEAEGNYWYPGGVSGATTISTEAPWAGAYSAKINLSESNSAWIGSEYISVKPGEPLTLSGFVKTVSVAGDGARMQVQYYDQNYNYLSLSATKYQTGTQDYTRYAVATTPPAGAAYAKVFGAVFSSTGTAYFDNIKVVFRSTTWYQYDSAGNYLTDLVDPLGNWTDFKYDAAGNVTEVNDPKGQITKFSYDVLNNLTSVTDALGKISRYEYDPVSLQVTYRDGRSSSASDNTYRTSFAYNQINQLVSTTDPLGRKVTNTYDDSANLASVAFPNGKQIIYSYDSANRLTQKSYSAETTSYSYSYDSAGNLKQVTDNTSKSYQYAYDKANRLTSLTDIFGYQLNYTLDDAGNTAAVSDSNGKSTSYTYGSYEQLLALTDTSGRQTLFRYDEAGRPFNIIKGNGIKSTYLYDAAGRISAIEDPGNPDNSIFFYKYDANGNIVKAESVNGSQIFAYDALNRLTSWTDEVGSITTYAYDAVGNLTKKGNKTYTYNAANEITNSGFACDSNGNVTSDGNFNYQYNSENQLVKVTKVSDGSTVATYEYNYRGLRVAKTTADGTIRYHWDDKDRLVRESDASGNTIALYTYAGDQLISIEKGGAIYYTHTNFRGDILAITDANQQRVATYKYGPWGELIGKTGTFDIPIRYAGYYFDAETGMYYLKARYYSPELGRFLTKDTFKGFNENPQSLNLYAYCNGNPVMNVDPSGQYSFTFSFGFKSYVTLEGGWNWIGIAFNITPGGLINVGIGVAVGGAVGYAVKRFIEWKLYTLAASVIGTWLAKQLTGKLAALAAKKSFGYFTGGYNWLNKSIWGPTRYKWGL